VVLLKAPSRWPEPSDWCSTVNRLRRRHVILALAAVAVAGLAIPAFGSGGSLFGLARHADSKAKRALHRSRRALRRSSRALRRGDHAVGSAAAAAGLIGSTRIVSAEQPSTVSTSSDTYVDLGGPSVTATVLSSGLVDVWAGTDIEDNIDGGAVALFADGQLVPGQAQFCDPGVDRALLLWEGTGAGGPVSVATPSAVIGAGGGCGTLGPPGPVQVQVSPGSHTFELRYADPCPCGSSQFSNRLLRVAPRL